MYVGSGTVEGLGDLCLKINQLSQKDAKVESFTFVTSQTKVVEQIEKCISQEMNTKIFPPKFPSQKGKKNSKLKPQALKLIFDDVKSAEERALLAVGLGSDVWPGGIEGFGPAAAYRMMNELEEKNLSSKDQISWLASFLFFAWLIH